MKEQKVTKKINSMVYKNKIIKFISSLTIIAIIIPAVLLSKPKQTEAQLFTHDFIVSLFTGTTAGSTGASAVANVTNTAFTLKNFAKDILKQVIMSVQKRLLAQMTKSTVNWINSGFHGAPLFVENPKSFFKDIAKYEIKTFVDSIGYDSRRFPFGKSFALNVIGSYKQQFENNAEYTLSRVINDPALLYNYRTDFNVGGWNGFLINTQYPQNNYIGSQIMYSNELARRLEQPVNNNIKKVQETLQQGMGFLSPQTCPSNPNYNNLRNQFQKPSFKSTTPYNPPEEPIEPDRPDEGLLNANEDIANEYDRAYQEYLQVKKAWDDYHIEWSEQDVIERQTWDQTNSCPRGLVSTTPGSVVANQITTAMGSTFRQTELGAALGNSLSAIFDALLNKFIGSGLNALATKANPPPPKDEWSYDGQTLGSPVDGANGAWNSGPDEVIILNDFKKQIEGKTIVSTTTIVIINGFCTYPPSVIPIVQSQSICVANGGTWVADINPTPPGEEITTEEIGNTAGTATNKIYIPGDIMNTQTELALMDSINPSTPYVTTLSNALPPGCTTTTQFSATTGLPCNTGITQVISRIWPKIRELDICLPGPDRNWSNRTTKEMDRNSSKLSEKVSSSDGEKAAAAQLVYNDLQFAVSSFKDWINNKMITELPSSIIYMDAVDELETFYQQSEELITKKRKKTEALVRLLAIKAGLDVITVQPPTGSNEEKILVSLKKQYNAIQASISNAIGIEDTRDELAVTINKFDRLNNGDPTKGLVKKCETERTAKGWSAPDYTRSGASTRFTSSTGVSNTERELFCELPIKGGYPHGAFQKPAGFSPYKEQLPLVNGQDVYKYLSKLVAIFTFGIGGHRTVNIQMSCAIIYDASIIDYKKDLPGLTTITDVPDIVDDVADGTESGTCTVTETDPDTGIENTSSSKTSQGNCAGTWEADAPVTPPSSRTCTTSSGVPIIPIQTTQSGCNAFGGIWK